MTPYFDNGPVQLYHADARAMPLADGSISCVVTSPPYFGLRVYQDNDDRGIGLEASVEAYIANLVDVFREVRRVLRDDGVCWVNLGDSYGRDPAKGQHKPGDSGKEAYVYDNGGGRASSTFGENGNRLGIPERVVLALQADGWTWRDTIIWAKKSAMPESLAGWRWERCRVKVACANQTRAKGTEAQEVGAFSGSDNRDMAAQWSDCPGCAKCSANNGLVLRKGSWRTTSSHEYIYMLTKGMGYYADGEAVRIAEKNPGASAKQIAYQQSKRSGNEVRKGDLLVNDSIGTWRGNAEFGGGANRRSVWNDISPEPYGGAHFATFPSDLPRICIQASTSEAGCCSECGAQWARVVSSPTGGSTGQSWHNHQDDAESGNNKGSHGEGDFKTYEPAQTLGWRPTCRCGAKAVPALVLDPFAGTATTCLAAQRLGRRAVGVDLSEAYLEQAAKRLEAVPLPLGMTPHG